MTEIVGAVEESSILTPLNGKYSLYFHVPFCNRKCDYCHFFVIPNEVHHQILYMKALRQEWENRSWQLPKVSPVSIYFGGGTPSLLSPDHIESILNWICPSSSCEITLEVNPENAEREQMESFRHCGVNRISLGVQSFDDGMLKKLSRNHGSREATQAVWDVFKAGFQNISIDLMYDLPDQTLEIWRQTIDIAANLPITHLSLYNLTIEPQTVFYKKKKSLKLPSAEISLAMLMEATEFFEEKGLSRYEISAFARGGMISNHNIGYWTGRPFLGFGPSAFSYWNGSRFRNVPNLSRYAKSDNPIDFQERLPPLEKLKEEIAIGLRLLQGIHIKQWPPCLEKALASLQKEGFLERNHANLRLTAKGLLFHDTVAEQIINC